MSSTTKRATERGQVLVLFAGGLFTLLVIAALAFDVGMVLVERRDEQNAADAAALAGARYVLTDTTQATAAARQIATANGFSNGTFSQVVNVYIPAIHGRYAGLPGFIEVQIQNTRPSIFAGVMGKGSWAVGAFAVATNSQNLTFPFGMLALNPTACKAIQISGSGVVNSYGNIQANSNGSACTSGPPIGFSRTGGSTVNVIADDATCRTVGKIQDQGTGSMTCTKAENSFALPDPLRNLAAPTKPALAAPMVQVGGTGLAVPDYCPGAASPRNPNESSPRLCDVGGNGSTYNGKKWLLSPGLYPGGLKISNAATAYLLPGIYWIGGGGFNATTDGSVITVANAADAATGTWGGGVMIYNSKLPGSAGGDISGGGSSATFKIKPLNVASGDPNEIYNNMVVFQDRALSNTVTFNAAATVTEVSGIIYVPKGQVKLNGNTGTLTVDQIIADTFLIDGNGGTINVLRRSGVDAVIVAAGLVD